MDYSSFVLYHLMVFLMDNMVTVLLGSIAIYVVWAIWNLLMTVSDLKELGSDTSNISDQYGINSVYSVIADSATY